MLKDERTSPYDLLQPEPALLLALRLSLCPCGEWLLLCQRLCGHRPNLERPPSGSLCSRSSRKLFLLGVELELLLLLGQEGSASSRQGGRHGRGADRCRQRAERKPPCCKGA